MSLSIWLGTSFRPQKLTAEQEIDFARIARTKGMHVVAREMAPVQTKAMLIAFGIACICAFTAAILDSYRPLSSFWFGVQSVALGLIVWAVFQIPILFISGIVNFGRAYRYTEDICQRNPETGNP